MKSTATLIPFPVLSDSHGDAESLDTRKRETPAAAADNQDAQATDVADEKDEQRKPFLKLFLKHETELRAVIGSLVPDKCARDDVFQEVAMTLWASFGTFDQSRSFGAWARGVAINKVLHERRKNARFPRTFSDEAVQAMADAFARTEPPPHTTDRELALEQCLKRVPDKSARILALRYVENQPCQAIARKCGVSLDAVYQTLSRLRTELEKCIQQRIGGAPLA